MAGLRPLILGLVITTIFTFFIISFAVDFVAISNPTSPLLNNAMYNLTNSRNAMNSSLSSFTSNTQSLYTEAQTAQTDPISFVFLISRVAFSIPQTVLGIGFTGLGTLVDVLTTAFGASPMGRIASFGLSVVFAGLLITFIFLFIRAFRSGETER